MEVITINNRIKEIRKSLDMTQQTFGEKVGLSRNYIAMIEIGERVPSDRTLKDICREYSVNEYWLRTGNGEMFVEQSMEEEIAAFARKIINYGSESFQARFISALSKLDEPGWEVLKQIADNMAAENKKDRE